MGESTVTGLMAAAEQEGVEVKVIAGLSFVEPILTTLGIDGLDGLQIFDAIDLVRFHYPPLSVNVPLILGQVYSRHIAGQLKIVLMAVYPDDHEVSLIHAAGCEDERVENLPLHAIDRSRSIKHLTSLYVPPLSQAATLPSLAETVAILRSPEGCPWDQEQTPQSMRSGFLEEVSEVLEALDSEDAAGLQEELGDVLYHLVMQVQMAAEVGAFTLRDVIAGIEEKLRRRHPHVWGELELSSSAEVLHNWDQLKAEEKTQPGSLLDDLPRSLSALSHAQKIQQQVKKVGFDWPDMEGVYRKADEELAELKAAKTLEEKQLELGDLLFVVANLALWLGVDAESSLRDAIQRFGLRFRRVEELVAKRGLDWQALDLAALDKLWEEVKAELANGE
jgi:tetrapyrrole methylase family protein/MazG family protein